LRLSESTIIEDPEERKKGRGESAGFCGLDRELKLPPPGVVKKGGEKGKGGEWINRALADQKARALEEGTPTAKGEKRQTRPGLRFPGPEGGEKGRKERGGRQKREGRKNSHGFPIRQITTHRRHRLLLLEGDPEHDAFAFYDKPCFSGPGRKKS